MRRRDPYSWSVVRLPQGDLAELVVDLAAPLIAKLGPAPAVEEVRAAFALVVVFWNANVLAAKHWSYPRLKELKDLRKRMRGRAASREDAVVFDLLTERWRPHSLDPRLVESWTYETDVSGTPHFRCAMGFPEGVRVDVPPPVEKRIAIGGKFLDEVTISLGSNSALGFPVDRHRGAIADDGTATVEAMMPAALKLFAEGTLPRIGGDPVELVVSGRHLGPMVLTSLYCGGGHLQHDVAVLVFKPSGAEGHR
jgi:hypothetical protein